MTKSAMPKKKRRVRRSKKVQQLPQWKVLLHNDPINVVDDVVRAVQKFIHLDEQDAKLKVKEAHEKDVALLTVCWKERAELYELQFKGCSPPITVTIEEA